MAKKKQEFKVHHILADGREVDSVEGHVVNMPEGSQIARGFERTLRIIERIEAEKRTKTM